MRSLIRSYVWIMNNRKEERILRKKINIAFGIRFKIIDEKSLMKNNSGPKTDPWGAPERTGVYPEFCLFITNRW